MRGTLRWARADLRGRRGQVLLTIGVVAGMVAALFSLLAFAYCFPRDMLLLYGDAVAHLHIARRIIDSLNPGIRQIGSVWLPFPHVLMMPFAARLVWWQNGIAGATIFDVADLLCLRGG